MRYGVAGQGEPVILLHGLSGSSRWWVRNIPALAEHYTVYLVDLPGFGIMRRSRGHLILAEAAIWLAQWMEAVGLQHAHFVGHSMGGYICLLLAAYQPERVRRLVLVSPAGIAQKRSIFGYLVPLLAAIRYVTLSFSLILAYDILRAGPLTILRAAQDLLTQDVRKILHAVQSPTLLIWGENDTLVPIALGEILRREIAHSRLLILKQASHVSMFDRPREFNQALLAFLAGESGAR